MERLTEDIIDAAIDTIEFHKVGEKTTVCILTLQCGFEIITSSACIDPANYDEAVGRELACKRARDKVWELEGYRIQWNDWANKRPVTWLTEEPLADSAAKDAEDKQDIPFKNMGIHLTNKRG